MGIPDTLLSTCLSTLPFKFVASPISEDAEEIWFGIATAHDVEHTVADQINPLSCPKREQRISSSRFCLNSATFEAFLRDLQVWNTLSPDVILKIRSKMYKKARLGAKVDTVAPIKIHVAGAVKDKLRRPHRGDSFRRGGGNRCGRYVSTCLIS
ncbi:hypothetical protein L208DRAFT_1416852 [Tricholoma matsutake]|nr:hypothetical protein L208DRAFT_1416852 [Tricholoma matsutake 945]